MKESDGIPVVMTRACTRRSSEEGRGTGKDRGGGGAPAFARGIRRRPFLGAAKERQKYFFSIYI